MRSFEALAFRAAYVITGDAAEAEDAAQEAFVKACYALSRFRAGAPFRPWLLRIVANEARNRRQATARRGRLALRGAEAYAAGLAPSPEAAAVAAEARETLLRAVNGLRPGDRLVLAHRYFLDLSETEMAAALGCRPGTVKSRLSRALGWLRASLNVGTADDTTGAAYG